MFFAWFRRENGIPRFGPVRPDGGSAGQIGTFAETSSDTVPLVRKPPLKKALGQHHLVDGALCRPLIHFLAPEGEQVLEIGPGGGVLTAELLAAGARVLGWELDPDWAAVLRQRFPDRVLPWW